MKHLLELVGLIPYRHKNIRMQKALERIIENLDNIRIEDLEKLTKKL